MSTDRRMNEPNVIHTYKKCYSAWEEKGALPHATSRMRLEDMMLRNKPVTQRFHFCEVPRIVKFIEAEVEGSLPTARAWEEWGLVFNGYRVSVWKGGKVLRDRW